MPTAPEAPLGDAGRGVVVVRCLDDLSQAAPWRAQIDALNRHSDRPDPFSTFAHLQACLRLDEAFAERDGTQLWLLLAFRAERLVGYVALKRVERRVMGCRVATLGFLDTQDADRPHLVARASDEALVGAAVYRHLLARRDEWHQLELVQQGSASTLYPPPRGLDLSNYLLRQWPSLENCTILVRWPSLDGYVEALAKKFRTNLGRQLRGLSAAGRLETIASADPADTPALLELYLGIEPFSWKQGTDATIGRHPRRLALFRALLDPAQPMRVSIQLLLLDGVPVAGLITGAFERGLHALHLVYDDRLNRFAPGSAMLLLGMRQAIVEGHEVFNLRSGFGYYKERWLAQSTPLHVAQVYRAGSLPYWKRRLGDWKRRLWPGELPPAREQFNPARRDAAARAAHGATPERDIAQRERIAALVAQVRGGQGECLTSAQLAAILPLGGSGRLAAPGRQVAATAVGGP